MAIDYVEFVCVGYRGEIICSIEHEVREGRIDGGHRVFIDMRDRNIYIMGESRSNHFEVIINHYLFFATIKKYFENVPAKSWTPIFYF